MSEYGEFSLTSYESDIFDPQEILAEMANNEDRNAAYATHKTSHGGPSTDVIELDRSVEDKKKRTNDLQFRHPQKLYGQATADSTEGYKSNNYLYDGTGRKMKQRQFDGKRNRESTGKSR